MKKSGHLNPSEETGTGCPVTSKYGSTHFKQAWRYESTTTTTKLATICYLKYVLKYE